LRLGGNFGSFLRRGASKKAWRWNGIGELRVWHWLVAQTFDSVAVGVLWLAGLLILNVPLAPLWAGIAAGCQVIPQLGPLLGLMGLGMMTTADIVFSGQSWHRLLYLLILYVVIVLFDGFLLQPYLMRRTAKVSIWASIVAPIVAPIVLGVLIPFWGLLLAPPLLAIVYAYRARRVGRGEAGLSGRELRSS
jgi:predicted PurR-regulated permease PerM